MAIWSRDARGDFAPAFEGRCVGDLLGVAPGLVRCMADSRATILELGKGRAKQRAPTKAEAEALAKYDANERGAEASANLRAVYLAEGQGHCFVALTDDAVVSYLVSQVFNPQRELGVSPTDPDIGLRFPIPADELLLSPKDLAAPSLADAIASGTLPSYDECVAYERSLA